MKKIFNRVEYHIIVDENEIIPNELEHLDLGLILKKEIQSIEKVDIYLSDGRLIQNIFLLYKKLGYYDDYNPYEPYLKVYPPTPEKDIYEFCDFKKEDILLIRINNELKYQYKKKLDEKIFGLRECSKRQFEENNFVLNIRKWDNLPLISELNIYTR